MEHVGDFLKQYKKLSIPNESSRKAVQETLKKICGFYIPLNKIIIKGSTARLNLKPTERTLVYIKKTEVLQNLKKEIKNTIRDIR